MRTININNSWIIILSMILLNGCKAPEAYRNALDAFSNGAAMEMSDRFPANDIETGSELPNDFMFFDDLYKTNSTVDTNKAFSQYYQDALTQANAAIKGAPQLEKINVLDNAYAVKALILWRQSDFEAASDIAKQAEPMLQKDNGEENDVRDLAMMQALPGLINIEKAYKALLQTQELSKNFGPLSTQGVTERQVAYEEIKGLYEAYVMNETDGAHSISRGLALIERAIDNVDDNSAIVLYLRNAQLAALDTWGDMLVNVFNASRRLSTSEFLPNEGAWVSAERKKYEDQMDTYLTGLAKLLNGGEEHKLYKYWQRVL